MSARDVPSVREVMEGQIGKWSTTYMLDALTAAGYTIVRKDEVREAALEEAAVHISSYGVLGYVCADAIRSLKLKEHSNG